MKNLKKLSLQKEVKKEAEQIEKEVSRHTELDDLKVSDEMETSLFNKIQEYEYDKRFKVVYHRKKKRHYLIIALAAVLVIVAGSAMTGVGSKSYWKVMWEQIAGDAGITGIDVDDMESHESEDIDEMGVYREINEKFGIASVRLRYKPSGTILTRYIIDEAQRKAFLFYKYNDEIIRYTIYMNDTDSSLGQKELDTLIDEYDFQISNVNIHVEKYSIENLEKNRFIAEFEYQDVQYQLIGALHQEEFEKILENLFFVKNSVSFSE